MKREASCSLSFTNITPWYCLYVVFTCGFTTMLHHTSLASMQTYILQKSAKQQEICGREKVMVKVVMDKTISVACVCIFQWCKTDSSISHKLCGNCAHKRKGTKMSHLFPNRYRCHTNIFNLLSVLRGWWRGKNALGQQHDNTFARSLIHHQNIMVWTYSSLYSCFTLFSANCQL